MKRDSSSRLLAICPDVVRPDHSGGNLRFASMLEILESSMGADLFIPGVDFYIGDPAHASLRNYFKGNIIADEWGGRPIFLAAEKYRACLVEFWNLAERVLPVMRRCAPWMPVVVDSVDVHFVREAAAVDLGLMPAAVAAENKRREIAVYQKADAIIAVTEEDREALQAAGVARPIHLVPNIVSVRPRPAISRRREILFVGGFDHPPNLDGLLWFVRECWPMIREKVPGAVLTVVGSKAPAEVLALSSVEGIEVAGYVRDMGIHFDRAAVSIAPLRYGAGMKMKVCEALAAGVPLVTTTIGIQGLPVREHAGARVQDTAEGFASAVVWTLTGEEAAEKMGREGREIIDQVCGRECVAKKIGAIFAEGEGLLNRKAPVGWRLYAGMMGSILKIRG